MNQSQILTIEIPVELYSSLMQQAVIQGHSLNQLITYWLTLQLLRQEQLAALEMRLSQQSLPELQAKAISILDNIPSREVPKWDARELI